MRESLEPRDRRPAWLRTVLISQAVQQFDAGFQYRLPLQQTVTVALNNGIWRCAKPRVPKSRYRKRTGTVELARQLMRIPLGFAESSMQNPFCGVCPLLNLGIVASKRLDPVDIVDLLPQQVD